MHIELDRSTLLKRTGVLPLGACLLSWGARAGQGSEATDSGPHWSVRAGDGEIWDNGVWQEKKLCPLSSRSPDSFVEMICMHAPASEHSLALLITIIIVSCSLNFMLFK